MIKGSQMIKRSMTRPTDAARLQQHTARRELRHRVQMGRQKQVADSVKYEVASEELLRVLVNDIEDALSPDDCAEFKSRLEIYPKGNPAGAHPETGEDGDPVGELYFGILSVAAWRTGPRGPSWSLAQRVIEMRERLFPGSMQAHVEIELPDRERWFDHD